MDLKMEQPAEETLFLLREYYHHNPEPLLSVLSDDCCWISPMRQVFLGADTIRAQFAGGLLYPIFHLREAQFYQIDSGSADQITVYGEYNAYSDLDSKMLLAEWQRITFCYRREKSGWRLYHMHVSNPWNQVAENEVFPDQCSRKTYEYLQECIAEQKSKIEKQTAMLRRLSYEDSLTGLFNRNKLNQMMEFCKDHHFTQLGIACFDLNGLKQTNDRLGHAAGDQLLSCTADHMKQKFAGKAYRIGGDEFIIVDEDAGEREFYEAVAAVQKSMAEDGISISSGISWRSARCNFEEQFNEADRLMYEEKKRYYEMHQHERRRE